MARISPTIARDRDVPVIDYQERIIARQTELSHPQWVVMWGCYTRAFWAFPRFSVSPGTLVSAWSLEDLLFHMISVEIEFGARPLVARYTSPPPAAQLPRRIPLAIRRGLLARQPALVPAPPAERRPVRTNYDPFISGPLLPGGFDADGPDWDSNGSFWPDGPEISGPDGW
jgi:hypothetical protein